MPFTADALFSKLPVLTKNQRLVVAYSGGLDSLVLLHALTQLRDSQITHFELEAIHVHHGVNARADDWVSHCQHICEQLQVPLAVRYVELGETQANLENQLRDARYQIFAEQLNSGDMLVLAHHADDQAETLLLRMLRGAGPQGLAGMPVQRPLGEGCLLRPLLDFSRAELELYAQQHQLSWVEDDSNVDTRFDRNYLRHEVIPKLAERWPRVRETFSRNAQVSTEAAITLNYFLERELRPVMAQNQGGLVCDWLLGFEPALQRNLLRGWLKKLNLPLCGAKHLQQIVDEVASAATDANPLLCWSGVEVRRFKGVIYALKPLAEYDAKAVFEWTIPQSLSLSGAGGRLCIEQHVGQGLLVTDGASVSVRFRQGGEYCRLAGRGHGKLLKKLLNELQVPPWLRDRVPLIYIDNELAAVADLCICEGFQAAAGHTGFLVQWQRP
jgi:tRNA(Ile)-lysidine synthase